MRVTTIDRLDKRKPSKHAVLSPAVALNTPIPGLQIGYSMGSSAARDIPSAVNYTALGLRPRAV